MTPEQEALIVSMRDMVAEPERFSYDRLVEMCEDGFVGKPVRMPPPTDEHSGYYKAEPSTAGALVLAIAAERDLYRLKAEWLEARIRHADAALDLSDASEEGADEEIIERARVALDASCQAEDEAEAAYVAAGGVA